MGALISVIIIFLAIIVLFIMRPKLLIMEEENQILQTPLDKKRLDKLLFTDV